MYAPHQSRGSELGGGALSLATRRRRGSANARWSAALGAEAVFRRQRIAPSETPRRRRERRRGERERGRHRPERDEYPRCHARPGSGPQPSTPREGVASCAGLDPEGVYVYVERVDGRANRPSYIGRTRIEAEGRHSRA